MDNNDTVDSIITDHFITGRPCRFFYGKGLPDGKPIWMVKEPDMDQ